MEFKTFLRDMNEFSKDLNYLKTLMKVSRYYNLDEKMSVEFTRKDTSLNLLTDMFKFISINYFDYEFEVPEPEFDCIEWLNNDWDSCYEEMTMGIDIIGDWYLDFKFGYYDYEFSVEDFIDTLYNDMRNLIILYAGSLRRANVRDNFVEAIEEELDRTFIMDEEEEYDLPF